MHSNWFIQMLCWGVRDMKKFQLQSVISPLVEIQCEKTVYRTEAIVDTSENPNFPNPNPIVLKMVRNYCLLKELDIQ